MSNKIALVTGGNRGLGKNITTRLAENGTSVIITYRGHEDEAAGVVAELEKKSVKSTALQLDVGDISSLSAFKQEVVQALSDKWQKSTLDILVNNAGFGGHYPIGNTPEEDFDALFNVHLKGVYFLTESILPMLADNGRIVNLSSGLARFSFPGYAAYAMMKGAIEVFTRYLAKELGGRGITANAVAPGAIDNDFNKDRFDAMPQMREMIAGMTALGRVGVSKDIGGVVAFLCSEDARWITGQRIEVSGGMLI